MRRSQSGRKRSKKRRRRRPSPRNSPNYGKYDPFRKSPSRSATVYPVGFMMTGNDGNLWRISQGKRGIKRWVKVKLSNGGYGRGRSRYGRRR